MPSLSNAAIRLAPDTLQGALWLIAGSAVFWALEAWLLFSVAPSLETLPRLLVFSECVGTVIVVCVLLLRRSRWVPKAGPVVRWLLTGVIAIPAGYAAALKLDFSAALARHEENESPAHLLERAQGAVASAAWWPKTRRRQANCRGYPLFRRASHTEATNAAQRGTANSVASRAAIAATIFAATAWTETSRAASVNEGRHGTARAGY